MTYHGHTGSWRAMGCDVDVLIVGGGAALLELARTMIDHLEQCWSRFLPESDISRVNRAAGSMVHVDQATTRLLRAMVDGWRATAGAFDPTLLAPLVGLGYAASWHDPATVTSLPHGALPRGDLDQVSIDVDRSNVVVPAGMCLDAGGIGKGLAADMVVERLLAAGASGALVSIGGDVSAAGEPPQPGGWLVGVADPIDDHREAGQLAIVSGGVATSGTLRRTWHDGDGHAVHHLLDPATGRSVEHTRQIVAVTVVAGTAAWAEVWTKSVMVGGAAMLPGLDRHGLGAQLTYEDGTTATNQSWSAFDALRQQRCDLAGEELDVLVV